MSFTSSTTRSFASIADSLVPNLPGFKPRMVPFGKAPKRQIFQHVEGQLFINEAALTGLTGGGAVIDDNPESLAGTSIILQSMTGGPSASIAAGASSSSSHASTASHAPSHQTSARRQLGLEGGDWPVLQFGGYYSEDVQFSQVEHARIRRVVIRYYTCDDTLTITEARSVNSGLLQGPVLKRCAAPRKASASGVGTGGCVTLDDLHLGGWVMIASREYFLVEASQHTRAYLQDVLQRTLPPVDALSYPEDEAKLRSQALVAKAAATRPTGSIATHTALNYVDNSGRAKFLRYGSTCVSFDCVWDDRSKTYGDLLKFRLIYHLCDDTVEVVSSPSAATAGRDTHKVLLRRGKLPRDVTRPSAGHYTWQDLHIGLVLNVYCRVLQVVDADSATRAFYRQQGTLLGEAIPDEARPQLTFVREIPPPTGFGTEEDSMLSVTGSIGGGGRVVARRGENKTLSFTAKLKSSKPEDQQRRFVIQYFLWDNTLKVFEPPIRNSGFTGGTFFSRNSVTRRDGSGLITDVDFVIGDELPLPVGTFILLDAGESTWRHMEAHPHRFPLSDVKSVFARVRAGLYEAATVGELQAQIYRIVDASGASGASGAGGVSQDPSITAMITDMVNAGAFDESMTSTSGAYGTTGMGASMYSQQTLNLGDSMVLGISSDVMLNRDTLNALLRSYGVDLHAQALTSLVRALSSRRGEFRAKKLVYEVLTPTEDFV